MRDLLVAGLNAMPSSRSLPPSEELKKLHEAIGFSLGQWQFVEAELGRLFVVLTKSQNQWAANSGFFAVHSFYSKMEMVNSAAHRALVQKRWLLEEWDNQIYKALDKNSKLRNSLAHFSIVVRGELSSTKHVYFLESTWFDHENYFETNPTRYHFENVKQFGIQFSEVSVQISEFAKKAREAS